MFENKKAVIFDLDGTLLDTMGLWNEIDAQLIEFLGGKRHNLISHERNQFLEKNKGQNMYFEYAVYLKERYHFTLQPEDIHRIRNEIAIEFMINKADFKPKADIFAKRLKELKFQLGIATLSTRWAMDIYMNQNKNIPAKCNINETIDFILYKDDVHRPKPDPEVYLKSLERLRMHSNDCIVVEDSLVGVQAAKNAGIQVIGIYDEYANQDREKINQLVDYSVSDYNELIEELDKTYTKKHIRQ